MVKKDYPRPRFRGVRIYRDPRGRFSFIHPTDWYEFDLNESREGVMFSPYPHDPKTWFSVWITGLHEHVVVEDLEVLREGVNEGLSQLLKCMVEEESEQAFGNLIKFERIYTFEDEDGETRRRKTWMLYVDKWQMVVTWQGENEEEYNYWLPMGNYFFSTFNLPETLWFVTDRDLTGNART